jgi:hypothetical protein
MGIRERDLIIVMSTPFQDFNVTLSDRTDNNFFLWCAGDNFAFKALVSTAASPHRFS